MLRNRGSAFESRGRGCLGRLRQHLLEDADCNRVICDNIFTSTPIEVYANESDWAPFKNLCGHLQELKSIEKPLKCTPRTLWQELFLGLFDLGVSASAAQKRCFFVAF